MAVNRTGCSIIVRLALLVLLGCSGPPRAAIGPAPTPQPAPAPAPTPAAIECGTIDEWADPNLCAPNRHAVFRCFLDALRAHHEARFVWRETGDDSRVEREYRVVPGAPREVAVSSLEQYEPTAVTLQCETAAIEPTSGGCDVLATRACVCQPTDAC